MTDVPSYYLPRHRGPRRRVPPDHLLDALMAKEGADYGVTVRQIWASTGRRQSGVDLLARIARTRAWRTLKELGYSIKAIAVASGYDHSTVLNSLLKQDVWEERLRWQQRQAAEKLFPPIAQMERKAA